MSFRKEKKTAERIMYVRTCVCLKLIFVEEGEAICCFVNFFLYVVVLVFQNLIICVVI